MSDSRSRFQTLKRFAPLSLGIALSALLILGGVWSVLKWGKTNLKPLTPTGQASPNPSSGTDPSQTSAQDAQLALITQLALVPVEQRSPHLLRLAQDKGNSVQSQARFILAGDDLQGNDGESALKLLEGLELKIPTLASEILLLRATALSQLGKSSEANATWKTIITQHPQDPAVVEAFYALGKGEPSYWNQALKTFPAHPLSVEIAIQGLKKEPNRKDLLLLVARHGLHLPDLNPYLKGLTDQHGKTLTPEDWHAVGFAYWEKLAYKESGEAYARAPQSALNRYRAARCLQIADQTRAAIAAYQGMIAAYPKAKETPLALLQLGEIVDPPNQRISYLDQAIELAQAQKRPHLVADILLSKATALKRLNNQPAQAQVESILLKDYGSTRAAASFRWDQAQAQAKAGNLSAARDTSLAIATTAPHSRLAPIALFWSGKWSQRLGQSAQQQQAFTQLWKNHPDSYYAWRSASLSGWPVGDFQSVRNLRPETVWPKTQLPLAAGSAALQDLYNLGFYRQAWKRWVVEFKQREQPSFLEQQTDGLIRNGVGEYLDGIFMLNNLDDRLEDEPEHQALYEQWRSHPGFWYALYPLAYYPQTAGWAQQLNLNPLLALGLMRQESRFQPKILSSAGAVGLMQVLPETGEWIGTQIGLKKFNLENPSDNIRFGTWYLDYTHRTYDNDSSLAIASYNAGPGNVATWLKERKTEDPDEFLASIPFSETRNYVTAVLENHWNYLRLYDPRYVSLIQQKVP